MKTLICTVGGSHQPVITAIQESEPEFILFVCSDDDPDTGKSGSYEQIEKKGIFLKAKFSDEKPSLPNIPVQLNLSDDQYAVLRVYPDDLDDCYRNISEQLYDFVKSGKQIVADYTGGTKTMSAALCLAALDYDSVSLQLVSGTRADLIKVRDGTESAQTAQVGRTRFQINLKQALKFWQFFAYDEAILHLQDQRPSHRDDRGLLQGVRNLSKAFSAWDRFDHLAALQILEGYMKKYGKQLAPYLGQLRMLCADPTDSPSSVPARLFDLWLNAQRRAEQQRFDDATSRAYRLLEWSAQWLLEQQAGIRTDNIPAEKIPDSMQLVPTSTGIFKTGLRDSWQLADYHCDDSVKTFWDQNENRMVDLLTIRNASILAHGFKPIASEEWQRIARFIEVELLPLLQQHADTVGLRKMPMQLPTELLLAKPL